MTDLDTQLTTAHQRLAAAIIQRDNYVTRADNRHWTELDSATGSGIRHKRNPKADAARFAAYDREAAAFAAVAPLETQVKVLQSRIADRDRVRLTRDDIVGAQFIRTQFGWSRVVRVNKVTVTIPTAWSWTETVAFDKILEVRAHEQI